MITMATFFVYHFGFWTGVCVHRFVELYKENKEIDALIEKHKNK